MLNRVVVGLFRSKMEIKSSKSVCRWIFFCFCFLILFLRLNDASIVQKYSCQVSKLSDFPGVIFSKRVTVDDVPRKTFFFAPRGEHSPLIFRVVVMEYRSMPTHVAAGRTLLDRDLCKRSASRHHLHARQTPRTVQEASSRVP